MNHLVEKPVPLFDARRGRLSLNDLLLDPPTMRERAFKTGHLWTIYVRATKDKHFALISNGAADDEMAEAVRSQSDANAVVTTFEAVGCREEVSRLALSLSAPTQSEVVLRFSES